MSPRSGSIASFVRSVLGGYRHIAAGTGALVLFFLAVAAAAAAVVLPLWLLSTRLPGLFTALTASAFGGLALFVAAAGAWRRTRLWGGAGRWLRMRVGPMAARVATGLALLGLLYGALLLLAIRRGVLAVVALVALLILVGLRAHHRRTVPREESGLPADDRGDVPSR